MPGNNVLVQPDRRQIALRSGEPGAPPRVSPALRRLAPRHDLSRDRAVSARDAAADRIEDRARRIFVDADARRARPGARIDVVVVGEVGVQFHCALRIAWSTTRADDLIVRARAKLRTRADAIATRVRADPAASTTVGSSVPVGSSLVPPPCANPAASTTVGSSPLQRSEQNGSRACGASTDSVASTRCAIAGAARGSLWRGSELATPGTGPQTRACAVRREAC